MAEIEVVLGMPAVGGNGEANTNSNAGAGVGLVLSKVGVNTPIKTILNGANVTITEQADTITISSENTGEDNTNSNAGAGAGLVLPKVGVDTPIKSMVAGANMSIIPGSDTLTFSSLSTTAGVFGFIYFTAEQVNVNGTNYYSTSTINAGTVPQATQTLSLNDNEKAFFAQDYISIPFSSSFTAPGGGYGGQWVFEVSSNGGGQRITTEIYLAENDGTIINSGIVDSPIGNKGFQVITILDSGIFDLEDDEPFPIPMSGEVLDSFTPAAGQRFVYHVSAEKVGTTGGAVDMTIYSGVQYKSLVQVPIPVATSTVVNDSGLPGATSSDSQNYLNTVKQDFASPQDFKASSFNIQSGDRNTTFTVFGAGSTITVTVTAGCLAVGEIVYINVGDSDGFTPAAGAGANLIGDVGAKTLPGSLIGFLRLPNDSVGLTGEVYQVI